MSKKTRASLLAACLVIVVLVGAGSRLVHTGFLLVDKYLGDALYAAVFYLLLALVWPTGMPWRRVLVVCAVLLSIELFQLTYIPARLYWSGNLEHRK
jgi:hypothetical protein